MDDAPLTDADERDLAWYCRDLQTLGIRRIHVLAWRDLDDPDAGGSEVHADEFMRRWADHGLEVLHRTSEGAGLSATTRRHGYGVVRRGSRYSVFPRTALAEMTSRMGRFDALVEIVNGVPWWSQLWCRRPRLTIIHHVHGPMWDQIMPPPLARAGRFMEARLAPPVYRRGLTVTPSEATRAELLELGFRPDRVVAVPNGVQPRFGPGGDRTPHPSVVAVGRFAPVKRFDRLVDAALEARRRVPDLELTIIGDGPLRSEVADRVAAAGAGEWIHLPGRLDDAAVVAAYRRSWLVASASLAEGWGLSLTEAAACGTPAVATDIAGHRSSVVDGTTGVLAPVELLGATIADVLLDDHRRATLGAAALDRARTLTWDASALGVTATLHRAVSERRSAPRSR